MSKTTSAKQFKKDFKPILDFFGLKETGNIISDLMAIKEAVNQDSYLDSIIKFTFKVYDTDGNGTIDKDEFKPVIRDLIASLSPTFSKVLQKVSESARKSLGPFASIIGGDGVAELEGDFQKIVDDFEVDLKQSLNENGVEDEFKNTDLDGDGKIDFFEFSTKFKSFLKETQVIIGELERLLSSEKQEISQFQGDHDFQTMCCELNSFVIGDIPVYLNNDDLKPKIEACVNNKKCTLSVTGANYASQKIYQCSDCGMDGLGVVICESCINQCHQGHKIMDTGSVMDCFCDCGSQSVCCCSDK